MVFLHKWSISRWIWSARLYGQFLMCKTALSPNENRLQICQKSERISCVIPRCKLHCGITQPILRIFWHIGILLTGGLIYNPISTSVAFIRSHRHFCSTPKRGIHMGVDEAQAGRQVPSAARRTSGRAGIRGQPNATSLSLTHPQRCQLLSATRCRWYTLIEERAMSKW